MRRAYHRRRERMVRGVMFLNKKEVNNVNFYLNCLKLKPGKKTPLNASQNNHSQDAQW